MKQAVLAVGVRMGVRVDVGMCGNHLSTSGSQGGNHLSTSGGQGGTTAMDAAGLLMKQKQHKKPNREHILVIIEIAWAWETAR